MLATGLDVFQIIRVANCFIVNLLHVNARRMMDINCNEFMKYVDVKKHHNVEPYVTIVRACTVTIVRACILTIVQVCIVTIEHVR